MFHMSKSVDILDNEINLTENDMDIVNELIANNSQNNVDTFVKIREYMDKLVKYFLLIIIFFSLIFIAKKIPFEEIVNKRYTKKMLENAAYNYTWMEGIDLEVGKGTKVQISELKDRKLIKDTELIDNCIGYVGIINKKYKYRYKIHMICDK